MIPAQAVEAGVDALLTALANSGPGAYIQEDNGPSDCVIDGHGLDVPACVTKALEAAAPHMLRQVWDEAYSKGWDAARGEPDTPNPYESSH